MNFSNWLQSDPLFPGAYNRAELVGVRIAEKPTSIVIQRDGAADLAAQTVRIEPMSYSSETLGQNATVSKATLVITGYKGHPSVPDTNIRRGDRFVAHNVLYDVIEVVHSFTDRVVATARVSE